MDREQTPAATTAEPSTPSEPQKPRRNPNWGKVKVAEQPPAEPATTQPERQARSRTQAPKPPSEAPQRQPRERAVATEEPPTAPTIDEAPDEASDADAAGDASTNGSGPARRRRRGGRGRGGGQRQQTVEDGVGVADGPSTPETEEIERPKPRQRQPKAQPAEPDASEQAEDATADGEEATTPARRRRRRGGRGRGGKKPSTTATEADDGLAGETVETQRDDATPDGSDGAAKPRRRRSGKRPDQPEAEQAPKRSKPKTLEEQIAAGGPTRGIRTTRSRTPRERRRRDQAPPPPRITDKLMVITENGERDQIAVLEEDVLVQHYVTRSGATSMVGNVYLGRVQNVLPGMEAAFVDVGRGRNGVLYAGEVNYSPEDIDGPAPRIEQLLKAGQSVMVQVTKDPMGGKGARLTANLSLAGRYLVLAPNQNLQGISRRLGDDARKRLKSMLKRVKPPEHGVIVRTAAEGVSEEELEADLRRLLSIWNDIQKKAKKGKAPTVLYEEPELTVRVVRDLFTDEEFRGLETDSKRIYDNIRGYLTEVAPDLAQKVDLHTGKLPVFEQHRIVEQIHKALDKKVWLPSGGYLFIERTEAMTIVDVNTGKSVGKTNLEETVVNTNLEAAREAARQLRLRDIGGIIVIDFIDMLLDKNKKQVEDTMREALALDKTRSQVFEIGPLGLMQVTRKRVSSGLVESFSETCPTCEGRGFILTYDVN
jgi:ribonuclease E